MNRSVWSDKNVFLTGHTGFKGSWLALLLDILGAKVSGYALAPITEPNLFNLANVSSIIQANNIADINNYNSLRFALQKSQPTVVIHLAAQALVKESYLNPVETWSTNVIGLVNTLEAVKECSSVRAVLVVTTDKCYQNHEWVWGYRETDPLGGYDPYSASKASAEFVVDSYRRSFFNKKNVSIATARAGNVIGGGDWSKDRIIPDIIRSVNKKAPTLVSHPDSTRPWQHVLDALAGYLDFLELMLEGGEYPKALNFGPGVDGNKSVRELLIEFQKNWPEVEWKEDCVSDLHEASQLFLDTNYARSRLMWSPKWNFERAVFFTVDWYRQILESPSLAEHVTREQINQYIRHRNG